MSIFWKGRHINTPAFKNRGLFLEWNFKGHVKFEKYVKNIFHAVKLVCNDQPMAGGRYCSTNVVSNFVQNNLMVTLHYFEFYLKRPVKKLYLF